MELWDTILPSWQTLSRRRRHKYYCVGWIIIGYLVGVSEMNRRILLYTCWAHDHVSRGILSTQVAAWTLTSREITHRTPTYSHGDNQQITHTQNINSHAEDQLTQKYRFTHKSRKSTHTNTEQQKNNQNTGNGNSHKENTHTESKPTRTHRAPTHTLKVCCISVTSWKCFLSIFS